MVKGSSKALREAGVTLNLECKNEELADSQILHRKKQLEDIYMLQTALQGATQLNTSLTSSLVNGGSGLHGITSTIDTAAANNASNQLMGFLARNGNVNGNSGLLNKRKLGNKTTLPDTSSSSITIPQPQPHQSLTQALRATRKSAGSVFSAKTLQQPNKEAEPDIEVLQEMKTTKAGGNPTPRTILPKPGVKGVNKGPTIKGNNLLLLNINIRPRNLAPVSVNSVKRKDLDNKVKVILMKTPSEFVEWLLREGLIRSQQLCSTHKGLNRQPTKLKLGVFSDPLVLTSSGGYVWIGECCGRKYISVYSGSIFGSTPIDKIPPTAILKLMYHWSCQTSLNNVETWVKVDKQIISKVYHYMKCICSVILHDKIFDFGEEETPVELGIVSLGTTTADGSKKAVKVEILGLYDRQSKSYRLFASTPEPSSNSRERFLRILKPVREVIHKKAKIICDQSVDPTCLHSMGYSEVQVCSSSENENDPNTNSVIMFYLRKHVPKMFQAALSQLTEHQVQLTLDELCWREKFGATSAECYDKIMENISYITLRELENPGVLPLLEYVAEYPHKNFRYKFNSNVVLAPPMPENIVSLASGSAPLNVMASQYNENKCLVMTNKVMMTKNGTMASEPQVPPITIRNLNSLTGSNFKQQSLSPKDILPAEIANNLQSGEYTDLEPYFYGRIEGNPSMGKEHNSYNYKCHLCSEILEDNISFYSHLKYHFEGQSVEKEKLDLMCPYCTVPFSSVNGLNKHKIDVHLMSDLTQVWCRICAEKFPSESYLKTHMMRKHVEAELPYRCEVCHFATSFYYEIINHFTRNHKGTPYIQCHFCLCVKIFSPNGAASFSQRLFQHMQRHAQKIHCRSCVLVFYSKYLLTEHKKEHLSCANVNGVVRYESPNGYRVLQFKPNIKSMPLAINGQVTSLQTKNQAALSITQQEIPDLRLKVAPEALAYKCIECDGELGTKAHFNTYRKCAKCPYFTNCQNMIVKHAQIFHPSSQKKPLPYYIGNPIKLEEQWNCVCGFSTKSGNHLANHLGHCKKHNAFILKSNIKRVDKVEKKISPAVVPVDDSSEVTIEEPSKVVDIPDSEEPMEVIDDDDDDDGDLPILPLSVEIEEE